MKNTKQQQLRPILKPRHVINIGNDAVERVYTTKKLKLYVDEDQFKNIIMLIAEVAAYAISITRSNELPEITTFVRAWLPAKLAIAKLIANQYSTVVEPGNLCRINLTVMQHGYGLLEVTEVLPCSNGDKERRTWNFVLCDETECTLHMKYLYVINNLSALTDEQKQTYLSTFSNI